MMIKLLIRFSACTTHDFYYYYTPCNEQGKRHKIAEWIKPHLCNASRIDSVMLPPMMEEECCKLRFKNSHFQWIHIVPLDKRLPIRHVNIAELEKLEMEEHMNAFHVKLENFQITEQFIMRNL